MENYNKVIHVNFEAKKKTQPKKIDDQPGVLVTFDLSESKTPDKKVWESNLNLEEREERLSTYRKNLKGLEIGSDTLKDSIDHWADILFDIYEPGEYKDLLEKPGSILKVRGASALLQEKMHIADSEGRELQMDEKNEISNAFFFAGRSREVEEENLQQVYELNEIASNVDDVVEIMRRLKADDN